jgi:hypothetical protein
MFPQLRRFSREEILHVVETSSKSAKVFLLDFCINRSSLVSRLDGTSKRFERVDFGGKVYIRARYGSLSSLPPSLIFRIAFHLISPYLASGAFVLPLPSVSVQFRA